MSIKLSRVLPPINLTLAVALLEWGYHSRSPVTLDTVWVPTPILFCYGVNAPAFRISELAHHLLISLFGDLPSKISHSSDLLFVIFVAIFWYLVGRRADCFRSAHAFVEPAHGSLPLFSIACSLFSQNTRVGVA
jgi:hypothetical protein